MAFSSSHMFRQWIADCLTRTQTGLNFGSNAFTVALYGNTGTPDENATAANSAYNVAQWVTANEVWQAVQWPQGGVALSSTTGTSNFTGTSDAVWYGAANTASGSAATLAAVYGDMVYDSTLTTPVANQGIAFHYYGGSQSVTSGTFTVIWNAGGVWRITV